MNDRSQLLKGTLEGCILKIISLKEVYGYEIAMLLKEHGLEEVSEGTIYPLLLRLEKNGLLISVKKDSSLGPKRKYYSLSDRGEAELRDFQSSWEWLKKSIDSILED